jgi:hypothetical protein
VRDWTSTSGGLLIRELNFQYRLTYWSNQRSLLVALQTSERSNCKCRREEFATLYRIGSACEWDVYTCDRLENEDQIATRDRVTLFSTRVTNVQSTERHAIQQRRSLWPGSVSHTACEPHGHTFRNQAGVLSNCATVASRQAQWVQYQIGKL